MAKYKKRPDGRYATSTIVGYTDDVKHCTVVQLWNWTKRSPSSRACKIKASLSMMRV